MRPIDADLVIEKVMNYCVDDDGSCVEANTDIRELLDEIENLPTVQSQSTAGQLDDGARSTAQSTDLIDRQAAIDALDKRFDNIPMENTTEVLMLRKDLRELPAVQAERQRGEWIDYTEDGYVECPFCHSATNCDWNKDELHFCFSCGADMRGVRKNG